MKLDVTNPRAAGRAAIEATVPPELWALNDRFAQALASKLLRHPLRSHPIREFLESEKLSPKKSLLLHLEFGFAFGQIFTDAVLQAMALASQLEPRLGPRGKVSARFLWAMNLMDELGYQPSGDLQSYAGHPRAAHYAQFVEMFSRLGAPESALNSQTPSAASLEARHTFESHYGDYLLLTTVLAMSESIFDGFAGSWADNVERSTGLDTSSGYHTIHVQDDEGHSVDDEHSEDSWTLVKQALTPERFAEVDARVDEWLDAWARFADNLIQQCIE